MRFNEAGAIEPRNAAVYDGTPHVPEGFNEAGAIEPRNGTMDATTEKLIGASMRPGQ